MKAGVTKLRSYAIKAVIVLLLIILAYLYVPFQGPENIKLFINSYGVAPPLVFIVICVIRPVIFFLPPMGLTIIAGSLFGPLYGALYVVLGGAGSTIVGFYLARWCGRKGVERFLKGRKNFLEIDEKCEEKVLNNPDVKAIQPSLGSCKLFSRSFKGKLQGFL